MNDNNNQQLPSAFPADADTINAIVEAMGALVISLCRHLPTEAKDGIASDLARLSANSTASGRPIVGRLMGDLSRAAAL